jgi:hypothetical protein
MESKDTDNGEGAQHKDTINGNDGYLEHQPTHATYYEKEEIAALSEEHRQYLLQRHGTLELDPIPTFAAADPYNWPQWKVHVILIITSSITRH